jgi:hypothetical protein
MAITQPGCRLDIEGGSKMNKEESARAIEKRS